MEIQTSGKPIDLLMEKVLCMNILSSDYFKELYRLKTYHEVIDEIYNHVDHVEPWMTGNCRGPSTAFCLLYKFFTMKLTVKQMHGLLKHPDSPYIRAIGFLYLRYVADPKILWTWYEPYLKDDEEFSPGSNGRNTTMGVYVRDLILGQYYFDSLLPRIPLPVTRQVTANLEKMKLPTKLSGVTGDSSRQGSEDTARRPPSVKASLSVSFGQRAPHRASTRDSSPVRRTVTHDDNRRSFSPSRRSGSHEGPDRDHSDRELDRSNRDRDRDRSSRDRDRDRSSRDWDRDRDKDIRDYHRRERDSRDRDYRSRHSEERQDDRRDRDSNRHRRSSSRHRSRSRSRSRSRNEQRSSPFGDANKEKTAVVSSNLAKLKDLYGDVTEKKQDGDAEKLRRDSCAEEVIRLGGPKWR
ncbi:pre-mRNA splicing factor SR-like 1 isoform X2 [Phragmites australis]|uniref:pre-mRNA splicing factor SR-like 1 isoform X2 n=1 Tax=Phragmites australis TaxID=29695 RepID=UPI002D7695F1|nr:pre-mRNA splicing factor SR-like 1 isoform X2 [Phragmites australis]